MQARRRQLAYRGLPRRVLSSSHNASERPAACHGQLERRPVRHARSAEVRMHMERQGGQQELLGADRAKRGVFVTPGFRVQWPITEDLATLRRRLRAFGIAAELTEQRLSDLVLAANEAASIVLRHGSESNDRNLWIAGKGCTFPDHPLKVSR
ncbi:MAG: hypothetical protein IRY84_08140 [Thermobispora bispora]|nr:hypothetical protein [Thermobispora bispora]